MLTYDVLCNGFIRMGKLDTRDFYFIRLDVTDLLKMKCRTGEEPF